jgi:hypothetical protein
VFSSESNYETHGVHFDGQIQHHSVAFTEKIRLAAHGIPSRGAFGVDFFDPSAVRAANRKVLLASAETPSQSAPSGKPADELAVPFPAPV